MFFREPDVFVVHVSTKFTAGYQERVPSTPACSTHRRSLTRRESITINKQMAKLQANIPMEMKYGSSLTVHNFKVRTCRRHTAFLSGQLVVNRAFRNNGVSSRQNCSRWRVHGRNEYAWWDLEFAIEIVKFLWFARCANVSTVTNIKASNIEGYVMYARKVFAKMAEIYLGHELYRHIE